MFDEAVSDILSIAALAVATVSMLCLPALIGG